MDCIMNAGIFLRANGNFVCWDDAGCNTVVKPYNATLDAAHDIYLGEPYARIRDKLAAGIMPFPDVCTKCIALNPASPFDPAPSTQRRIRYFQVESSFACQIRCPNCYPGVVRKDAITRTTAGHLNLRLDSFERIIADFSRAGVSIDVLEFQGHGEPLINKDIWKMVAYARQNYPDVHIRIITNGNFDFRPEMIDSGVSEMIFSIDGTDQASYERYRVGGDFAQAYDFMREFCGAAREHGSKIHTSWKYILFDHCSDPDQLAAACRLAEQCKVDDLVFVTTQMGPSSKRFFSTLLRLRERSATDPAALRVLQRMETPTPVAWLSEQIEQLLGESPFPRISQSPANGETAPRLMSVCYMPMVDGLDKHLTSAVTFHERGDHERCGKDIVALATKLWRLYEGRYELLTPLHRQMIRQAGHFLSFVPPEDQKEFFLKAECFAEQLSIDAPTSADLVPVVNNHLLEVQGPGFYASTGVDPSFILFSSGLAPPCGKIRLQIDAEVLDGQVEAPCFYFDFGNGYSEENKVQLFEGRLKTCEVELTIPPGLRRLRFDPGSSVGRFHLGRIAYTPAALSSTLVPTSVAKLVSRHVLGGLEILRHRGSRLLGQAASGR